ncbi:hypothetical protein [Sphingomonas bacterium]|uniref:hypothetical protein n=1 Tax=Sphingomonas bacterium TaxID=1895847 RepID=UPI002639C9BA|nr:hypothetical protein [Sphingomonas bacterium]MDB5679026.1 hypothetical protein [Sphingomonas bacterium]
MATKPQPLHIRCSATGTKLIAPPMTDAEACARFIRAVGTASATPIAAQVSGTIGDGLSVELRFLPQGVAMASVTRVRAGRPQPPMRYELAVSDRGFRAVDIDRLARDVAAGMLAAPPRR